MFYILVITTYYKDYKLLKLLLNEAVFYHLSDKIFNWNYNSVEQNLISLTK